MTSLVAAQTAIKHFEEEFNVDEYIKHVFVAGEDEAQDTSDDDEEDGSEEDEEDSDEENEDSEEEESD